MLLVDDAEAEAGELTVGSISAWVPTISPSSPLASWSRARSRTGAGVAPVSSANGIASSASSRPSVIACCSARVSVGAINAAWNPASSARSIA